MQIDLDKLTSRVFKMQTITACKKFREAAAIYLEKSSDEAYQDKVIKSTDALLFKFTLATLSLEFLWEISDNRETSPNFEAVEKYEWNNNISIMDSLFFESTIIQTRAFLDLARRLTCVLHKRNIQFNNSKTFYKELKEIEAPDREKIISYFKSVDASWEENIIKMRDKMVHYGFILTNHSTAPTIRGKQYEEYAQWHANNPMFKILTELSELLFDVKWVSGTFDEFKRYHST